MSREVRRTDGPSLPKVERIEVSVKRPKLRLALVIALALLGAGLISYGVYGLMNRGAGWQEISVTNSAALNCGGDLTLSYRFEKGRISAENKLLTILYTQLCERAYALFQPTREMTGVKNLYTVNASPNVPVEVEPELYEALSLVQESGSRAVYLAPIYAEYDQIFFSGSAGEAAPFDPFTDPEQQAYFAEVLNYVGDPAHVDLELLGGNTVCLHVSDEYLRFAEDYTIEAFVDFHWMKNAFIVDYIAAELLENGFTRAVLTSHDGFSRVFCEDEAEIYTYNLLDRSDGKILVAAQMDYRGPCSLVSLQSFPANDSYTDYYFEMEPGVFRTAYIDPADGLCRCAVPTLVGRYEAVSAGCAEILLQLAPLYIADTFDAQAAEALSQRADDNLSGGVYTVYCTGDTIVCNDPGAVLREVYYTYTVK